MRVLQIINSLDIGGAEKLLVDSIPRYIQKGIDMELLLLNGNETYFYRQLKAKGVVIHSLTKGSIKKIYNPLLIFRLIPFLRKYDIIHVHLFPALYWVALAKLLSFSKIQFIFTEHNTNNRRMEKGGIWRVIDKITYSRYNKIISVSEKVNTRIQNHLSITQAKFAVINNGINLSVFISSPDIIDKKNIKIIQIAGFREQKDQPTLIRAMQHLSENFALLLIGDGETRKESEELTKELRLSDRVQFLGIRSDIPQLLQTADIVVISSNWEGFCLAAVEGMATGKPVVASDVDGLKQVVEGAGLLFEKGNEQDLAAKISSLIDDPKLYKDVATRCRERSKQYDINLMITKYLNLYNSLLYDHIKRK
ncbi:MAG: glycosyltransferase [Dysgonamonadaceae bacterium]|jgi:glycosyltransferase involved in cell wall biosynthesis|nr:glycosyltransferase [Dysgonamonadaceae bacterium]